MDFLDMSGSFLRLPSVVTNDQIIKNAMVFKIGNQNQNSQLSVEREFTRKENLNKLKGEQQAENVFEAITFATFVTSDESYKGDLYVNAVKHFNVLDLVKVVIPAISNSIVNTPSMSSDHKIDCVMGLSKWIMEQPGSDEYAFDIVTQISMFFTRYQLTSFGSDQCHKVVSDIISMMKTSPMMVSILSPLNTVLMGLGNKNKNLETLVNGILMVMSKSSDDDKTQYFNDVINAQRLGDISISESTLAKTFVSEVVKHNDTAVTMSLISVLIGEDSAGVHVGRNKDIIMGIGEVNDSRAVDRIIKIMAVN